MNHLAIKSIAGIAYIQTMFRQLSNVDKGSYFNKVVIDGLLGKDTYNALNELVFKLFGLTAINQRPINPIISVENQIRDLQQWYNDVLSELPPNKRTAFTVMDIDGMWGDETLKGFDILFRIYATTAIHNKFNSPFKPKSPVGFNDREFSLPPGERVKNNYLLGCYLLEHRNPLKLSYEDSIILQQAGRHTPNRTALLMDNEYALVCKDNLTGKGLGVAIFTKPDRSIGKYAMELVGLGIGLGGNDHEVTNKLIEEIKKLSDIDKVNVRLTRTAFNSAIVSLCKIAGFETDVW